jgi:hypothetical protein
VTPMEKLDAAIEGLRKDIAEFNDIVCKPRLWIDDPQRVLTKAPPEVCPCPKHKRYQAVLPPRGCEACQGYYDRKHRG